MTWSGACRGSGRAGPASGPAPGSTFPRFKRKGRSRDSFRLTGAIRLHGRAVTLPRIGTVRLCEDSARWVERIAQGSVRVTSATVSREADVWFVSLAVEAERAIPVSNGSGDTVGVDLGVLALATLSDGTVFSGPKALRRGLHQLRRLSRAHSRKRRGSRNRARAARRLARHHAKIATIRRDHLHKLTTTLAKTHCKDGAESSKEEEEVSSSRKGIEVWRKGWTTPRAVEAVL